MSVISVTEINAGRGFEVNVDGSVTGTKCYRVITDDPTDDGFTLTEATDPSTGVRVPGLGEPFSGLGQPPVIGPGLGVEHALTVQSKSQAPEGDGMKKHVITVQYATASGMVEPINPMNRDADWEWSTVSTSEAMTHDITGKACVNTAKTPFDPPLTRDINLLQLHVRWNLPRYSPLLMRNYKDVINSGGFTCPGLDGLAVPARTAKILGFSLVKRKDWSKPYVEIGISFLFGGAPFVEFEDAGPFDQVKVSMGMTQLVDGERCACLVQDTKLTEDGHWEPVWNDPPTNSKPKMVRPQDEQPLDANGEQVKGAGEPAKLLFKPYFELPFNQLRLPTV